MAESTSESVTVEVEFQGGLHNLFAKKKALTARFEDCSSVSMRDFLKHLKDDHLTERPELFLDSKQESVRPGILVLINEADWELEGGLDSELSDGDAVVLISTLHGG